MSTSISKTIVDFELIDHGIEHEQYFQGCGLAFTKFADVATGVGDNPAEAIDDALESLAQNDWETDGIEARILAEEGWTELPVEPSVYGEDAADFEDEEGEVNDSLHYYVSIRVR